MSLRSAAPWYMHPAEDPGAWKGLWAGGRLAFAVVNVDDGPGTAPDHDYYQTVFAEPSKTPLLGYVSVGYGDRSASVVRREALAWREWYGVSGLMLDEVPAVAQRNSWSLDLIDQLRVDGATQVVANPGTVPVPELLLSADVTCVYEGPWDVYRGLRPPPRWLRRTDPNRQWHLVHSCPAPALPAARRLAARRGAGYLWATPGTLPNPWRTLPEEW